MNSEKQFKELVSRPDTLIKLTAMNTLQGKSMIEQIRILSELGLKPRQIASPLGTSANYVRVARSKLKKRKTITSINLNVHARSHYGK